MEPWQWIDLVFISAVAAFMLYQERWCNRIPDSRKTGKGFWIVPHGWSAKVQPLSKIQKENQDDEQA
jgi:hypothetical protein